MNVRGKARAAAMGLWAVSVAAARGSRTGLLGADPVDAGGAPGPDAPPLGEGDAEPDARAAIDATDAPIVEGGRLDVTTDCGTPPTCRHAFRVTANVPPTKLLVERSRRANSHAPLVPTAPGTAPAGVPESAPRFTRWVSYGYPAGANLAPLNAVTYSAR